MNLFEMENLLALLRSKNAWGEPLTPEEMVHADFLRRRIGRLGAGQSPAGQSPWLAKTARDETHFNLGQTVEHERDRLGQDRG